MASRRMFIHGVAAGALGVADGRVREDGMTTGRQGGGNEIPVVADAAEREVRFKAPVPGQRVHNMEASAIEMWDGEGWRAVLLGRHGLDVRDFGARGDGAADDTDALQAALEAAVETRQALHVSAGQYRFQGTLSVRTSGVRVIGESIGTTQLLYEGSGNAIELVGGGRGYEVLYGSFEGMSLVGTRRAACGIRAFRHGRMSFVNLSVERFGHHGIWMSDGWAPSFLGCHVRDNGGDGLTVESGEQHQAHQLTMIDCMVVGNAGKGLHYVNSASGAGGTFLSCTFSDNDVGAVVDGGYAHAFVRPYMENNRTTDLVLGGQYRVYNATVEGGYFLSTRQVNGVAIDLVDHGNTLLGNCYFFQKKVGMVARRRGGMAMTVRQPVMYGCTTELEYEGRDIGVSQRTVTFGQEVLDIDVVRSGLQCADGLVVGSPDKDDAVMRFRSPEGDAVLLWSPDLGQLRVNRGFGANAVNVAWSARPAAPLEGLVIYADRGDGQLKVIDPTGRVRAIRLT